MRVALVLLLLVSPLAAAEHVYSHRIVIEGRLIGGDGLPLPGRVIELDVTGERLTEPCEGGHSQITDEWGDFRFCYHRHEVDPRAVVRVSSGNASAERPIDPDLRRMVFYLRDENATGVAPELWEFTYFVDGRVWERGPAVLEGVRVSGITFPDVAVNLTLLNVSDAQGRGIYYALRADPFGDYSAQIRFSQVEHAEYALFRASAEGFDGRVEAPADLAFHRNTIDLAYPLEDPAGGPPPGSTSGPISFTLLLAAALALSLVVAVVARKGRGDASTAG